LARYTEYPPNFRIFICTCFLMIGRKQNLVKKELVPRGLEAKYEWSCPAASFSDATGFKGFRPARHGVDFAEEMPMLADQAIEYYNGRETGPKLPQSTGFTQVHVSGLPEECDDDEVADKLRYVLETKRRQHLEEVALQADTLGETADDVDVDGSEAVDKDPTTELEAATESATTELEAATDSEICTDTPDEIVPLEVFATCTVVRNKDTLVCKGYCFLAFATLAEAKAAVNFLNDGVEVVGCAIKAQLSQPKDFKLKHVPVAAKGPELSDLRCRRKCYEGVGKKAAYGHFAQSTGTDEGGGRTQTRNSIGRINSGVGGTRNGGDGYDGGVNGGLGGAGHGHVGNSSGANNGWGRKSIASTMSGFKA